MPILDPTHHTELEGTFDIELLVSGNSSVPPFLVEPHGLSVKKNILIRHVMPPLDY